VQICEIALRIFLSVSRHNSFAYSLMEKSMLPYGEPDTLYSIDDLLQGYDRNGPMAFAKSWDFRTYGTYFAMASRRRKPWISALLRLGMTPGLPKAPKEFLERDSAPKLVGIMGGHGLPRSTTGAYAAVARLAKHLTRKGYSIVTGGGPGAMEAGHLGVTFSKQRIRH
jgi:hypothetical protein